MTALATTNGAGAAPPSRAARSEAIEKALVNGDLSGLSLAERMDFYTMRCDAAGLDPRSQPFQYMLLSGKLTLYATKAAADQLIAAHHLTVTILSRGFDKVTGLYEVQARATFPSGQSVDDVGVLFVPEKMSGEPLANSVMKCVTKAKRRTVLSACGLGMLDETEVDSIQGAVRITAENQRVLERPAGGGYVAPPSHEPKSQEVSEVRAWIRGQIAAANDHLRNHLLIEHKGDQYQPVAKEPQVAQALVSRWIAASLMEEAEVQTENARGELVRDRAKVGAAVQVAWSEDAEEVKADVRAYLDGKVREALLAAGVVVDEDDEPANVNAED